MVSSAPFFERQVTIMLELATISDWEDINRLSAQVSELHTAWRPDLFRNAEISYPKEVLEQMIREKQLFVAKVNGTVVGYTAFWIWDANGPCSVPRKVLSINAFCVDEMARGHGIGTQMMAELRILGKAFGCSDLQLTVYPQNDEAVSFYQKCGFTIKSIDMQRKI